jgi:predicted ATPase/DNA-binding SARP family transcriptional activator/predicted negative regulator of RcsB-dependent stress response
MLTVAVLGPVEVRRDGELVSVPAGKTTEVLVRLALAAPHPVRAELLIDDLWADEVGSTNKNTLQSKVSQLRRALGGADLLISAGRGYRLAVTADDVDALRVEGLTARASAALRAGDARACLELTTEGLSLFRGDVLADAGDGAWLEAHRTRLAELEGGLLSDQLAARVELSPGADVIAALEVAIAQHPLREALWISLITALYRAGRQSDALAAYSRVRGQLAEELGIDPGPALRSLETLILQQSPDLDQTPAAERSRGPLPQAMPVHALQPGNLPGITSALVGRGLELEELTNKLAASRLVTLTGPGGVGKTRLAVEVARGTQVPGGSWLIRLDTVEPGVPLAQAVAELMELPGGEAKLFERLASNSTLLVLDNCEHLIDDVATLTTTLLDRAPGLRILATSQAPLRVDGETVVVLEPLAITDSIELFAQRASAARHQFAVDDGVRAVVEEVCQSLDGLPLAIELAAARVKSLSVNEIARRLDDRFALLKDPTSRRPERRRALAAAIDWSYALLFPDDQVGLQALSVFTGGAPLAAAESVLEALGVPAESSVDVVGRLVDRSLVTLDLTSDGKARYRLLDSIRAFALTRLEESGHTTKARAAHAQWFGEVADSCGLEIRGPRQSHWLSFVRAERPNIDAALTFCAAADPTLGVRIVNGFGWSWAVLGDGVAGSARIRAAVDAAASIDDSQRCTALLYSVWLEASAGDVVQAEADLQVATAICQALGSSELRADVETYAAFARLQQGRFAAAFESSSSAAAANRTLGRDQELASSQLLVAFASLMLGDVDNAKAAAAEALSIVTAQGDEWARVHAEAMLGGIALAEGRVQDAIESLSQAVEASIRLGFAGQAALHLTTLGSAQARLGDLPTSAATLRNAISTAAQSGDQRMAALASIQLAEVLFAGSDEDEARALLESAQRWLASAGGGPDTDRATALLASLQPK